MSDKGKYTSGTSISIDENGSVKERHYVSRSNDDDKAPEELIKCKSEFEAKYLAGMLGFNK